MSSTIDQHISQLLFDHECVTVSGFGSFIIRDYPAEINIATHMFRPATKRVSFNPSIKENDGLLAKQISSVDEIAYRQANESISISVRSWQKMLKAGKKVNLPGIGRLYMDESNRLQFNPAIEINYDRYSYGLNIFRAPSLQREIKIENTIHQAIEMEIPSKSKEEKKRRSMPLFFKAAAITALMGISLSSVLYFTDGDKSFQSISGLNPFSFFNSSDGNEEDIKSKSTFNIPTKTEEFVSKDPVITDKSKELTRATESPEVVNNKITKPFIPEVKVETKAPVKRTVAKSDVSLNSFHIIVGSFKERSNASNYVITLNAQGYDAYLAEGNSNFLRVAIGNFSNSAEAQQDLLNIKKELNPSAWVYHN